MMDKLHIIRISRIIFVSRFLPARTYNVYLMSAAFFVLVEKRTFCRKSGAIFVDTRNIADDGDSDGKPGGCLPGVDLSRTWEEGRVSGKKEEKAVLRVLGSRD